MKWSKIACKILSEPNGEKKNLLDLALANKDSLIDNSEVNKELAESDHKSLTLNISWNYLSNNQAKVPNFCTADYVELCDYFRLGHHLEKTQAGTTMVKLQGITWKV